MFILLQCAIVLGSGFLTLSPNHKNHGNILFSIRKTLKTTTVPMQNSEKNHYITVEKNRMFRLNLPVLH